MARLRQDGIEIVEMNDLPWETGEAAAYTMIQAEALEIHSDRLAERWQGYGAPTRARLMAGAAVTGADYVRARRVQSRLRQDWSEALARHAVEAVACPTMPSVAPREGQLDLFEGDVSYTALYALIGVPAVSVPIAPGEEGLPVGMQIAAACGHEGIVLDLAARAEAALGARPAPPHFADPFAS